MKKFLAIILVLVMAVALVACAKPAENNDNPVESQDAQKTEQSGEPTEPTTADGVEIAFVTDVGQLMDKSFNQGTWEGCEQYAKDNGKTVKYFQPANGTDATDADRFEATFSFFLSPLRIVPGALKINVSQAFIMSSSSICSFPANPA